MVGASGGVTPVSLISDGQLVSLRFFKDDLPARAFLPIRVDKTRYSNLMLRGGDGSGELVLSEETEAALRKGGVLGVAWLTEEPLSVSLAGSEQGLQDLRICGAQTATRHRERTAVELAARDRAAAEARAKALNDAQLAAVQAQTAAADAQRRQVEETAERQRRAEAAAADRLAMETRQRAYEDERRRAWERQQAYEDEVEERWAPPPPRPYVRPRYYDRY
ncbi:MAG: hypothetical protein DI570_19380 [Phenylobacterium zucineum]|nr:MAG: hypothetical protein DI570_19380 [Phenylobacterium zucineum]